MSRSIAIKMHRSPKQLKPFDDTDRAFIIVREAIGKWAARCNLNRNPEMPAGFRGRTADNWRCLVAIADDLGFGEAARAAAVVLSSDRQYENQHITLLTDIRTVFDRYNKDRLRTKAELIPALVGLEDNPWGEWTGLDGTAGPHTLTQGDIGRLLRPFAIRSKTLWPPGRGPGTKSESGYSRQQFEAAWASYCEPSATPPQPKRSRRNSRRRCNRRPAMQSNGPLTIGLPRRRKARHNGPRLVSSNRQSQVPRRVTWCRRDTGTMLLSFPNQSRSYDATLRAVRFWGHDGAMEVAFFFVN